MDMILFSWVWTVAIVLLYIFIYIVNIQIRHFSIINTIIKNKWQWCENYSVLLLVLGIFLPIFYYFMSMFSLNLVVVGS